MLAARSVCAFLAAFGSLAFCEDARPFPDAEGFGRNVKGGEGGKVIWVTNLESEGPGSLKEAVNTKGPRIIKFKVAGTIDLGRRGLLIGFAGKRGWARLRDEGKKDDEILNPYSYLTIDGFSAPWPGITVLGKISIGPYAMRQVIIRNLRIRDHGMASRAVADCLSVYANQVIIDHCSMQWARDEVSGAWYPNAHDITFQWCIFGPGWGPHGLGFLTGGGTDRITIHHCLFAHNQGRNPHLAGNSRKSWLGKYPNDTPIFDFRNNVVYNWYYAAGIADGAHANLVGNMYIPGKDMASHYTFIIYTKDRTKPTTAFLKGNITPKRLRDDMDEWADAGHSGYPDTGPKKWTHWPGPHEWGKKRDEPFPAAPVVTHSAEEAKKLVLSQGGTWPRDAIDAGVIRTVLQGTGRIGVKQTIPSDYTNKKPVAIASVSAKDNNPLAVSFDGRGEDPDGKVSMMTWDFGDGLRAIGSSVNHVYASPGRYIARLYVVDDRGMSGTTTLRLLVGKEGFKAETVKPSVAAPATKAVRAKLKPPTVVLPTALIAPPTGKDWLDAPRIEPFIDQLTWQKVADGEVDARLLRDAETIYVRVKCSLRPAYLKQVQSADKVIKGASCANIGYVKMMTFISPQHGRTPWYRFDVDLKGGVYSGRGAECEWKPHHPWRFASKVVDSQWQVTLSFPHETFQATPKPGDEWGLKLILNLAKSIMPIWPPVGPPLKDREGKEIICAPHSSDPAYYAMLRFP